MNEKFNKKGFLMAETIIVISVLAIGLMALYSTYVLLAKKGLSENSENPVNTYIAYYLNDYNLVTINNDYYYSEVFKEEDSYFYRYCGSLNSAECSSASAVSLEKAALLTNLKVDRVYYFNQDLITIIDNTLMSFDGSTVNYLNSLKNDEEFDNEASSAVIVKRKDESGVSFSYFQEEFSRNSRFLRERVLALGYDKLDSSLYTTPGRVISTTNEGLRTTIDDYGTSYYFRGAVENNYVEFADKCWRIVRITGNGAIKVVLYNDNPSGADNPCEAVGTNLAFARYTGTTFTSAFNSSVNYNSYIGYMYGNPTGTTYETVHANNTDSTILTNLKTWYDLSFTDMQKEMLADTIWCNDKSVVSGSGIGTISSNYGAYGRTRPAASASPSLICPEVGSDGKLSKFTASDTIYGNGKLRGVDGAGDAQYKIGLLTADEIEYAGSAYSSSYANTSYYLYKNANSNYSWTLSPFQFNGSLAINLYLQKTGYLVNLRVTNSAAVRPAVSLKMNTMVSRGTGTSTDPYVVYEINNNSIEDSKNLKDTIIAKADEDEQNLSSSYTAPGRVAATNDEGIRTATDDYGTSYYYRGATEDNYIEFAGKCWRIVRVTGNSAIKLILYNDNEDNVDSPCEIENSYAAFSSVTSGISDLYNNNAYVGFMYGDINGTTYALTHANNTDSEMLTALKSWYDTEFTETQKSMLADVIYCGDKNLSLGDGVGTSRTDTYYAAYGRIYSTTSANPSLVCSNDAMSGKLSKYTASDTTYGNGKLRGVNGVGTNEYKIGLITADEVAFAGGGRDLENESYYLYKNASGTDWWTMTPMFYVGGYSYGWAVASWGCLYHNKTYSIFPARPVVALNSTVEVTGDGTVDNPYVVVE